MEVQPQVSLGDVYDYWQHLERNGHTLQTSIKVICCEKKMFAVPITSKKKFTFSFFGDHNSQKQICRSLPFSSGCQLLGDTF